ncbi:ABC transporter permease [Dorea sp. D27]|uniref:ABC transporter permease n=1 Tax=Dorea sp. D27 TaxID=658665 RepID=UPI000673B493|nr:ABC transporter permease [Dorea sp. D27]KMZ53761.1 ribose ABC transporter, permease protein [Dorea sp. D27]
MRFLTHKKRTKNPALVSVLLFLLLAVMTCVLQSEAMSLDWINLKAEAAMTLILAAVGETMVLLIGGIDLSIAGVISLTNSFSAIYMLDSGSSIISVSFACILMGLAVGLFNGIVIQKFKVQPFIVTFSTWFICGGIAYLVLPKDGGKPPVSFANAMVTKIGGRLSVAVILIFLLTAAWLYFKKTKLGIYMYAVGSSDKAASLNGINVFRVKLFAYAASGVFAALAGVYRTAVVTSGSPTAGESFFNQAIAASVIGGTLLTGGRGGAVGTIFGALVLKMIADILVFAGVSSYWSTLFQGLLLIMAVLISTVSEIMKDRKEMLA